MADAASFPAFGARLRRARRSFGLKQAALADLLSVDQATVSRWERETSVPTPDVQRAAFALLGPQRCADDALARLVGHSIDCVHLVEESSHICLAYSAARARDWQTSRLAMLGVSLWPYATDDIRREEEALVNAGWWDQHTPSPRRFVTAPSQHGAIRISAGAITWERLYLSDGTPVRLVSGTRPSP